MIKPEDLAGVDEGLARRVILAGRVIAPCIVNLTGEDREDALAVLAGVAAEADERGARSVKSQRIGPGAVEYVAESAWFTDEDKSSLRALCVSVAPDSIPLGSFPRAGLVRRVWPEETDC